MLFDLIDEIILTSAYKCSTAELGEDFRTKEEKGMFLS